MAKNKKPNAYEMAKDNWKKYGKYFSTLQQVKSGAYVDELPEIASEAVADSMQDLIELGDNDNAAVLDDDFLETQGLDANNDKTTLYQRVRGGFHRAKRRHDRDFKKKENIEAIVNSTPDEVMEGIEKVIYKAKPKKNADGKYADAVSLHKELYEMSQLVDGYESEETKPAQKAAMEAGAVEYMNKYYDKLYKGNKEVKKDNEELINALKGWIGKDGKRAILRVARMRERMIERFRVKLSGLSDDEYTKLAKKNPDEIKKKILKNIPDYLLTAVDGKGIKRLYESAIGLEDKKEKSEGENED